MINFFTDETKFIRFSRIIYIIFETISLCGLFTDNITVVMIVALSAGILNIILVIKNNIKSIINVVSLGFIYIIAMIGISTYLNQGLSSLLNIKFDLVSHIIWFSLFFLHADIKKSNFKIEIYKFSKIFVIVTAIISIVSLIMYKTNFSFEFLNHTIKSIAVEGEYYGLYNHHNTNGFICAVTAISSLYLFLVAKSNTQKTIYVLCCIIQTIVLTMSCSRNAQLSFFIGILIIIFFYFKNIIILISTQKKKISIISGVIVLILFSFLASTFIISRNKVNEELNEVNYLSFLETLNANNCEIHVSETEWKLSMIGTGRYLIQKETFLLAIKSPYIGWGHLSLIDKSHDFYPTCYFLDGINNCHLVFLQAFYEIGWLGAIFSILIYLIIFVICCKNIFLRNNLFDVFLSSLCVICLLKAVLDTAMFFNGNVINSIIWLYFGNLYFRNKVKGEY